MQPYDYWVIISSYVSRTGVPYLSSGDVHLNQQLRLAL